MAAHFHEQLLTGNEAVARGAFEAGCVVGTGYPGTPSTEIIENLSRHTHIDCEWSINEKVALEVAVGASIAGCRAIVAMKHVGLNVAADPLFAAAYQGVNGGLVVVSADDPGFHSSQNEQDNRNYAPHAKVILLEPSDSQECLEFTRAAFALSERFDSPVLLRLTTRLCHSRTLVRIGEPETPAVREYHRDTGKHVPLPTNALRLHQRLEGRLRDVAEYAESCPFNAIEWGDDRIGIITSGISYQYAREAMGEEASYLKLGLTHPLPEGLIRHFASRVRELYVVEENDPYLERQVRALGIACRGKPMIPPCGELDSRLVRRALAGADEKVLGLADLDLPSREPVLCPGCPHRAIFYALGKLQDIVLANDYGCYTLGMSLPVSVTDTCLCMGGGLTVASGFDKAKRLAGRKGRIFGVMGDSTFFHSGITGLVNAVHNGSSIALILLDNGVTAMTGHQANPGTGVALRNPVARRVDIGAIVRACGVDDSHLRLVDPLDLSATESALEAAYRDDGLFVIIASSHCVLRRDAADVPAYEVRPDACGGCGDCIMTGCPAIRRDGAGVFIDAASCSGCGLCAQVCSFNAIRRSGA